MRKAWFVVVLALLCCVALSAPASAKWYPPSPTVTVNPGRSVWKVSVGMSRSSVRKALGQPSQSEGAKRDLWFEGGTDDAAWNDLSYIIVDYANGKVVQIVGNLPKAVIQSDFSTHSTLAQIRRKFKNIKRAGSFSNVDAREVIYSDKRQGISFSFTSTSDTASGSAEPTCFIVFKSGRRISPSWF